MISTIHTNEKFKQELGFDEFDLIMTALKLTGNKRWQRIIRFSHVIRDKDTRQMTDRIRTCIFFDDLMAIRDMDMRLRYDRDLLEESLDKMEAFSREMLERDTRFYEELAASKRKEP